MNIIERYNRIREEVDRAAMNCGRDPRSIKILAVSKTVPCEIIQEAIDSGITLLGENRVQEAKSKITTLQGTFTLHMVGHLQSNKAHDAVKLFELIHSVDKLKTAEALDSAAGKEGKKQRILIQIKTFNEETKSGISPEESMQLAENILRMENLILEGIMTIGPITDDPGITRSAFRDTASALRRINSELGLNLQELSMGMSGDFPLAVEEGSTILRIGTSIFGRRNY